jgi:hypothetical protein
MFLKALSSESILVFPFFSSLRCFSSFCSISKKAYSLSISKSPFIRFTNVLSSYIILKVSTFFSFFGYLYSLV